MEADQSGIRQPANQVPATPLVGEVDFAALFRDLDEPNANKSFQHSGPWGGQAQKQAGRLR